MLTVKEIMVRVKQWFWLLLMVLFCQPQIVSATEVVDVVFDNAYPPYMYGDITDVRGLYPTLIKNIFAQADISVQNEGFPWKRALQMGKAGHVAVAGVYPNQERRRLFHFSDPIFSEQLVIYVKKGSAFTFDDVKDLENKSIGIVRGYSYGDSFDHMIETGQVEAYPAKDNMANFGKLILGRIDCIITEKHSASLLIKSSQLGEQVEQLPVPFYSSSGYLVVAKDSHLSEVIPIFNSLLAQSKENGLFEQWVETFFQQSDIIPKEVSQVAPST